MRTLFYLSFLLLLASCGVNENTPSFPKGRYGGTFTIVENNGTETSGNVNFTFSESKYLCLPTKQYLPPTGAGTFELSKNAIVFTDTVVHTTNFDWTLILGGRFTYAYKNNTLVLSQHKKADNRKRTIRLTLIK